MEKGEHVFLLLFHVGNGRLLHRNVFDIVAKCDESILGQKGQVDVDATLVFVEFDPGMLTENVQELQVLRLVHLLDAILQRFEFYRRHELFVGASSSHYVFMSLSEIIGRHKDGHDEVSTDFDKHHVHLREQNVHIHEKVEPYEKRGDAGYGIGFERGDTDGFGNVLDLICNPGTQNFAIDGAHATVDETKCGDGNVFVNRINTKSQNVQVGIWPDAVDMGSQQVFLLQQYAEYRDDQNNPDQDTSRRPVDNAHGDVFFRVRKVEYTQPRHKVWVGRWF